MALSRLVWLVSRLNPHEVWATAFVAMIARKSRDWKSSLANGFLVGIDISAKDLVYPPLPVQMVYIPSSFWHNALAHTSWGFNLTRE